MSDTKKMCFCGFPQSYPIPHKHDQSEREKVIIKHFEQLNKQLLEACKEGERRIAFLLCKIIDAKTIIMDGVEIRKTESCISFIISAIEAAESQP